MIVEVFPVGPLQCNCVVIGDDVSKQAIVIDPGDDVDRIAAVLERHGLHVIAIVATHAHIDHVGGLALLKRMTGAPAFLHEADVPLYQALATQAQWLGVPAPEIETVDGFLDERKRFDVGPSRVSVLHTPGHSPGSVAFVLESGQPQPRVFSGDTLFAGSIGRTDLWGGSFDQLIASIVRSLLPFSDDVIVTPGHGTSTTIGAERSGNPFLQGVAT